MGTSPCKRPPPTPDSIESEFIPPPVQTRTIGTWMTRTSRRSVGILASLPILQNPTRFETEAIDKQVINVTRLDDLLRHVTFDDVTNRTVSSISDPKKIPPKRSGPFPDKLFKKPQNTSWSEKYFLHEQLSDVVADVKSQTHGCIDSSISGNIDESLALLNKINIDVDLILKERISEITDKEKHFIDEFTSMRDDLFRELLKENAQHVHNYEQQYQKLLREFIEKLELKLAAHLNRLQQQMEDERQKIFDRTNDHITQTTKRADQAKSNVLRQLQTHADRQRTIEMQNIRKHCSDRMNQTIGYEQLRTLSFKVYSTVGVKKDGHGCENIPERTQFIRNIQQAKAHQPTPPKRTVYLESEVLRKPNDTTNNGS